MCLEGQVQYHAIQSAFVWHGSNGQNFEGGGQVVFEGVPRDEACMPLLYLLEGFGMKCLSCIRHLG